jgi:hypothetical protein
VDSSAALNSQKSQKHQFFLFTISSKILKLLKEQFTDYLFGEE